MKWFLSLLFFITLSTPPLTAAPAENVDDDEIALEAEVDLEMSQMGKHSRLTSFFMGAYNAYSWASNSISAAWETITSFFSSLWDKTGHQVKKKIKRAVKGKKTHPLLEELKKSAPAREKEFLTAYTDTKIPRQ